VTGAAARLLAKGSSAVGAFWFEPGSPLRLGAVRVVVGAFTTWLLNRYVGVAWFLDHPLAPELYLGLHRTALVLAVLFTLGFAYRVVGPACALLSLFVITYGGNSWSFIFHTENVLCLHLLVLGFTPAAGALSVDALLAPRLPRVLALPCATPRPGPTDPESGWPVRLVQLCVALAYLMAGIAKVRAGGLAWMHGDNLRDQIALNGLYYELLAGGAKEVTFQVYGWETVFTVLAVGTLVLELGAPLALLNPWLGYLFVLSMIGVHWGIRWMMGIDFLYQLYGVAYAAFVPWEKLLMALRRLPRTLHGWLARVRFPARRERGEEK
jgi:hypothetical protein